MLFSSAHIFTRLKGEYMSFALLYRPTGVSEIPKAQNFLFEPDECGGYCATPITNLLSDIVPPKEVIEMDAKGRIRAPKVLLNQLRGEKSKSVVIVGMYDHIWIYSLRRYEEIDRTDK